MDPGADGAMHVVAIRRAAAGNMLMTSLCDLSVVDLVESWNPTWRRWPCRRWRLRMLYICFGVCVFVCLCVDTRSSTTSTVVRVVNGILGGPGQALSSTRACVVHVVLAMLNVDYCIEG